MKKKRLIAFIVLAAMVLTSMMPVCALAEGEEACEHVAGEAVTVPATFTEDGYITTSCTLCEEELTREVIPMVNGVKLTKTAYTYTGSVQKPAVTVKDSTGREIAAENYTITYQNGASKLPGKYGVTVTLQGESYSGEKQLFYTIAPAKVTGLKYSVSSTTSIKLSWGEAAGADKYEVYNATTKKRVAVVTGTSVTISKLTAGKSYNLKVRAYDADAKKYGAYSSALLINTFKTAIKNAAVTPSSITLSWSKVSGASGYYIYRRAKTTDSWKKIATVKGSSNVKYTDKVKGAYYYCVKAYKVSDKKTITGITSAAIRLRALKTPTAKVTSLTKGVKISWNKISGATGYMIQRRAADKNGKWTGSWTNVKTVGDVSSCNVDNGHGRYYHYRVRAIYKNNGVTSYGAYSSATTGWIGYYYPDIWFFMNYKTDSSCTSIPIKIRNDGKQTLRFYTSGARLYDKDYTVYNRDLYLVKQSNNFSPLNYQDIKPGETAWVIFAVDGNATWYDRNSKVVCRFRFDGVDYWGEFSFNKGFNWKNEFSEIGHVNAYGYGLV